MRRVDAASADHGMPGAVLMENAGAALARMALSLAGQQGRFFILCGSGNNGADGVVVAVCLSAGSPAARGRGAAKKGVIFCILRSATPPAR
jgi:NAD(P)H-hydrate repair Nnr-like enzyme with NAD(P)H-hydrate epimerase domain